MVNNNNNPSLIYDIESKEKRRLKERLRMVIESINSSLLSNSGEVKPVMTPREKRMTMVLHEDSPLLPKLPLLSIHDQPPPPTEGNIPLPQQLPPPPAEDES